MQVKILIILRDSLQFLTEQVVRSSKVLQNILAMFECYFGAEKVYRLLIQIGTLLLLLRAGIKRFL